jgi:hypothetical protein
MATNNSQLFFRRNSQIKSDKLNSRVLQYKNEIIQKQVQLRQIQLMNMLYLQNLTNTYSEVMPFQKPVEDVAVPEPLEVAVEEVAVAVAVEEAVVAVEEVAVAVEEVAVAVEEVAVAVEEVAVALEEVAVAEPVAVEESEGLVNSDITSNIEELVNSNNNPMVESINNNSLEKVVRLIPSIKFNGNIIFK